VMNSSNPASALPTSAYARRREAERSIDWNWVLFY
jgi:hypothetical protein